MLLVEIGAVGSRRARHIPIRAIKMIRLDRDSLELTVMGLPLGMRVNDSNSRAGAGDRGDEARSILAAIAAGVSAHRSDLCGFPNGPSLHNGTRPARSNERSGRPSRPGVMAEYP